MGLDPHAYDAYDAYKDDKCSDVCKDVIAKDISGLQMNFEIFAWQI